MTGADLTLQGVIAGDAVLVADDIVFGPDAKVAGAVTIYAEDPGSIKVPEAVAPAARIRIEEREQFSESEWSKKMPIQVPVWRVVTGFLALAHPGRAIWSGFLVTSRWQGRGSS